MYKCYFIKLNIQEEIIFKMHREFGENISCYRHFKYPDLTYVKNDVICTFNHGRDY